MQFHDRLRLFNQKAELLSQRSFFAHMISERTNVRLKWDKGVGWESSFTGPNDESIEASVLTIRQFMQNNDPISIRNVADAYVAAAAPEGVIDEFQKVRGWLNDYLNRKSNISISTGSHLTNREILEMFVYGGLGHSSEPHYSRYQELMSSPFADLVKVIFVDVLSKFMAGLDMLATVNNRILNPDA
ncbi:hypothetical protein ACGF5M_03165 [Gemmatimonadota bacterium]